MDLTSKEYYQKAIKLVGLVGLLSSPIPTAAAPKENFKIEEFDVTVDQLNNGISVLLTLNEDGTYEQTVYEDASIIPQPLATADGVLEWVVFHLDLKHWNDDTGDVKK